MKISMTKVTLLFQVASNILRTSPQGRTSIAQIAPLVRSEGTYPTEEALPGTLERSMYFRN